MLMYCKRCCYPNLPYESYCEKCRRELQTPEEEAEQKEHWDRLSAEAKSEFEKKVKDAQLYFRERAETLKSNLVYYIVLGAFVFSLLGAFKGFNPIVDSILGAVIVIVMYLNNGGAYWGVALFGIGFALSFAIKGSLSGGYGATIVLLFGLLLTLCVGYLFGMHLNMHRQDH
jgi:hypothetical protein